MSVEQKNEKKGKGKFVFIIIVTLLLAGGAATGIFFVQRNANYISTDHARVTTNQIIISANAPGILERFNLSVGQRVYRDEVLGWIESASSMRAPTDGLVINTSAVQGQLVSPGMPLAVIAETDKIHIRAYIEETDIRRLSLGQHASVTIDGFGNQQFMGYVSYIGHVTQAELTASPLFFNTGGNFTRVTHLIGVEISLIDDIHLDSSIGVNARIRIALR